MRDAPDHQPSVDRRSRPALRLGVDEAAEPLAETRLADLALADVGGTGLWLRAEPDEDSHQADALAAVVALGMRAA
ncbi:hypothetical protein J4558_20060 [Leptolyngbya sp. 15MV]|nr:hypothetical protein J4558_20060 [Leptolyngbya sp. 15MV]